MENAVDAGASSVKVLIRDSGRTLIQVIDDGCGMSPEDAVLAFERHATSKITEIEDLDRLMTFGFRGEALASIASVAEVTLRTRRAEDEMGTEIRISESRISGNTKVAAPAGIKFYCQKYILQHPGKAQVP